MAIGVEDRVSTRTAQTNAVPQPATSGPGLLFVDFQDSNPLAPSDAPTQRLTAGPTELTDRIIRNHQGQTIKVMGQSLLAEFPDPASAVRAAIAIERLQVESESDSSAVGPRIGIHLAAQGGMLEGFGRALHVAAGITRHAAASQILVSSEIQRAISAERDLTCQRSQAISLGEDSGQLEVYEILWAEMATGIPPRYEVLSRVGTGGMGIVYKVRDREIDDVIALKILKAGIADDPTMQENLRREVSLARKVTHKNVCRIHEFNRSGTTAYVSMEFIEGESLLAKLRGGPLSWEQALPIAHQICSGLREAHLQGIVHRDLKPANIMVDKSGTVKITDFGIARVFQGAGQMTGTLVGTPAYMAPEQVELKRIDARTDIYALGLLLYEIVTAVQAFPGDTPIAVAVKQLREFPKRPRLVVPTPPPHAEAIILKCLHKDPAERFQSIDELVMALSKPQQTQHSISPWRVFATQLRRLGREVHRQVRSGAVTIDRSIERQDWRRIWRVVTAKRARPALAVLGGLCVLTGLLALAPRLHSKKPSPAASSANAPAVHDAATFGTATSDASYVTGSATSADQSPAGGILRPMTDYSVDLAYSEVGTQKIIASADGSESAPKPAPKSPKSSPGADGHKSQPINVETAASRTAPSVTAQASLPESEPTAPAVPAKAESVATATLNATSSGASNAAPSVSDLDSAKETIPTDAAKEDSAQTVHYFSVGTFKDSTWADEAVSKLVQLGFPAVSVHKKTLWIQSYEVRVGPYEHHEDMDAAGKHLREFGFKPHPVK